jgi:hypothetical protein
MNRPSTSRQKPTTDEEQDRSNSVRTTESHVEDDRVFRKVECSDLRAHVRAEHVWVTKKRT